MGLSKSQVRLRYGFNQRLVETLLLEGVLAVLPGCTPRRPKIDPDSLCNLVEGEHYVICQECGAFQAQITTCHLKVCSGLNLPEYHQRHPRSAALSSLCSQNKAKTDQQRVRQSETLKARFQTPEGEETRRRIAESSRAFMEAGYQEQAAEHLRALAEDPDIREARRQEMIGRWRSGDFREVVEGWHQDNREESLRWAAHARRHSRKVSKPHKRLKGALNEAHIIGFRTEYEVGFYAIDEAHPDKKIAIEVDGCYWHGCQVCGFPGLSNNRRRDKSKTTYLVNRGWVVIRFPTHKVKSNLQGCVDAVRDVWLQRGAA